MPTIAFFSLQLQSLHKSPTPSPVKVPTATQQSYTELSISDMTSLMGVNTTSTLSSGQQELGEHGHGQPGGGVQGKQQSEAQENSPMWKGMPQPQFPARGIHTVQYINIYTKPSKSIVHFASSSIQTGAPADTDMETKSRMY